LDTIKEDFKLKFSICMPVYNGGSVILETLKSILSQSFNNYEIIIVDNNSIDNTADVVNSIKDPRIKYYKNSRNLGYPRNLEICRKKANNEIIFLMGHDDILAKDALLKTYNAFMIIDDIGAVSRAYYWFYENITKPVRAKKTISNNTAYSILYINDDPKKVLVLLSSLDQLSGLAFRREFMDIGFHEDIFPCHAYPFASILKEHPVVFLNEYTVAVRIGTSQSRNIPDIYRLSPLQSWVNMFESVYAEEKYKEFRTHYIKNFVSKNYVGLVQIRNYAEYKYLLREIYLLLKYRWKNIFNFSFWFYAVGCLIIPPFILIPLVDWYKNKIMSRDLKSVKFEYRI